MSKLKFNIHGLSQPMRGDEEPDFILSEQSWSDFGYMTLYKVIATTKLLKSEWSKDIGWLHIVRSGQEADKYNVLSDRFLGESTVVDSLPPDFFSISTDIDMFKVLFCILTPEERLDFIDSLRLILDDGSRLQLIRHDKCFSTSVLRNVSYEKLVESLKVPYVLMHSELNGKDILDTYINKVKHII